MGGRLAAFASRGRTIIVTLIVPIRVLGNRDTYSIRIPMLYCNRIVSVSVSVKNCHGHSCGHDTPKERYVLNMYSCIVLYACIGTNYGEDKRGTTRKQNIHQSKDSFRAGESDAYWKRARTGTMFSTRERKEAEGEDQQSLVLQSPKKPDDHFFEEIWATVVKSFLVKNEREAKESTSEKTGQAGKKTPGNPKKQKTDSPAKGSASGFGFFGIIIYSPGREL